MDESFEIPITFLRERLARGKTCTVALNGPSMEPLIPSGALLTVSRFEMQSLKIGDILIILRKNELITHRLVRMFSEGKSKRFLFKGDANLRFDPTVEELDLIGKVIAVESTPLEQLESSLVAERIAQFSYRQGKVYQWLRSHAFGEWTAHILRNRPRVKNTILITLNRLGRKKIKA